MHGFYPVLQSANQVMIGYLPWLPYCSIPNIYPYADSTLPCPDLASAHLLVFNCGIVKMHPIVGKSTGIIIDRCIRYSLYGSSARKILLSFIIFPGNNTWSGQSIIENHGNKGS